ncbi:MAG: tetratricopeptide repeat protein, partial [Cytophagaceae bacterium]
MKYVSFLILTLVYSVSALAQSARTPVEAQHFIKLGNTLRMVDRPEQAI